METQEPQLGTRPLRAAHELALALAHKHTRAPLPLSSPSWQAVPYQAPCNAYRYVANTTATEHTPAGDQAGSGAHPAWSWSNLRRAAWEGIQGGGLMYKDELPAGHETIPLEGRVDPSKRDEVPS